MDDKAPDGRRPRCIAVWLDGFSIAYAEQLMAQGVLPHLAALLAANPHVELEHGPSRLTGLAGEQFASGLDADDAGRNAAVHLDPTTYAVWQQGAVLPPVFDTVDVPVSVFDVSYFRLADAQRVTGVIDWGAHDPGGPRVARPAGLLDEIEDRFGAYPARDHVYATSWPDPDRVALAGTKLTAAVGRRGEIVRWLLGERLTDWQLALVAVSETHSASEAFWHGIDPDHVLADHPSAAAARDAMRSVHEAVDDVIGEIQDAFPDDVLAVFAMHGMGTNGSDVVSMAALGELVAAWDAGTTMRSSPVWPTSPTGTPWLAPGQAWSQAVLASLDATSAPESRDRMRRTVAGLWRRRPGGERRRRTAQLERAALDRKPLRWIPLTRHTAHWSSMKAFAIPSFYDGRIRVNLRGREGAGIVEATDYTTVLDELEQVLRECTDPLTGRPLVSSVVRPLEDPFTATETDADLIVEYAGQPLGVSHPRLGTAGPFPPRRMGGHNDPRGFLVVDHGVSLDDRVVASAQDVTPTLLALAGATTTARLSGRSLLAAGHSAPMP